MSIHPETDRCRAFVLRLKTCHCGITTKGFNFIGAAFDPLTQRETLSVKLALAKTRDSRWACENGANTVTILF